MLKENSIKKSFQDKELAKIKQIADQVMALEQKYAEMTNDRLHNMTKTFKILLNEGKTLDDILPDAFATVREVAWRLQGKKPYYSQVLGAIALHRGLIAEMKTGEGKCCPDYTPIPTPEGWKTVGDIKVGDYLFGRDGNPTKVIGVFPQGEIPIYEVILKDGRKVECGPEHRWTVFDNKKRTEKVLTTEEMFSDFRDVNRGYKYAIPMAEAVEYTTKNYKIDPYVMGCFLGDGCKNDVGIFEISSKDRELVHNVMELIGADYCKKRDQNYSWHFKVYDGDVHDRRLKIEDLDSNYVELLSQLYCHEKYIPEEYKLGSIEQRYALIQGLLDTDGNIYEGTPPNGMRYSIQYWTCSEKLRDDFIEVMNSLGYSCKWAEGHKNDYKGHRQYVVHVNVPNEEKPKLFRLSRKLEMAKRAANMPKRKDYSKIAVVDIVKTDRVAEQTCFTVDNDEHLFLIGNYVVTHNTLTETMPVYLNALTGNGVHVVTVNDYLAKRDAEEMGKIYNFLELSVGLVSSEMKDIYTKKKAYQCDITYGTNNEFGFDYLRDNMAKNPNSLVQRGHNYAIVDEVDSILIDEARTPLIISGGAEKNNGLYEKVAEFVRNLIPVRVIETESGEMAHENSDADYVIHEKKRIATLTPNGIQKAEEYFGIENLTATDNAFLFHLINQSIKAFGIMEKNIDYVVKDGEVQIVDEFTGRVMKGRQFNEGLHQSIEAKERVKITDATQTYATVTYQNFFRMYNKLSGMTGTAYTEKDEFKDIYNLDVIQIPTNKPVQRVDNKDIVYMTEEAKYNAIIDKIIECNKKGQPVLVGTPSIEKSELVAKKLKEKAPHIKARVLNAKNHELEAGIVAQAGRQGVVTISTNMAGRGTDIMLGGNPEFTAREALKKDPQFAKIVKKYAGLINMEDESPEALKHIEDELIEFTESFKPTENAMIIEARNRYKSIIKAYRMIAEVEKKAVTERGGLFVIGCERHESRRIDNQLIGRSGRQGDPGESQFFVSLEDDLMRLFGGEKMIKLLKATNNAEDASFQDESLEKAITMAQKSVEGQHFEQRKNVFDYDVIINQQRLNIYKERRMILEAEDIEPMYEQMVRQSLENTYEMYCPKKKFNFEAFKEIYGNAICNDEFPYLTEKSLSHCKDKNALIKELASYVMEFASKQKEIMSEEHYKSLLKQLLLDAIDFFWRRHLNNIEQLKKGIYLMSYGQKDPKVEFKCAAYELYDDMLDDIRLNFLRKSFSMHLMVRNNTVNMRKS